MIDLHVHTAYSDGRENLKEVLTRAEGMKMAAISITDHDTVDAYEELEKPEVRKLFGGKVLVGVELSTVFDGILVHIKGFEFDWREMQKRLRKKNRKFITVKDFFERLSVEMQAIFDKFGVEADFTNCKTHCEIAGEILKNIHLLPFEFDVTSPTTDNKKCVLYWKYIYKPNNALSIPLAEMYPNTLDAIELIRACGGKAVLAHPRQYYNFADHVLQSLANKIDGIEVYHWSANEEFQAKLKSICHENNLLMTGGTDFHACGKRDLNHEQIPESYIEQFSKFV